MRAHIESQRLTYKPPKNTNKQQNAVIVYLCSSDRKHIANLKLSLTLLDINFNDRYHYPVIVFHENFTNTIKAAIRNTTRSKLTFRQVDFQIPEFIDRTKVVENIVVDGNKFSIGYRHMCRFFSGILYRDIILADYEWYWRLDTDSFLLSRIDYDVFAYMKNNGYLYGYVAIPVEAPEAVEGLWQSVTDYVHERKIEPQFILRFVANNEWTREYYYTNFEISNLSFWRSRQYLDYFDYLDKLGGIYEHRWGDAPIHTLAVSMFMGEKQVHQFKDIVYLHGGVFNAGKSLCALKSTLLYMRLKLAGKGRVMNLLQLARMIHMIYS